MESHTCLEDNDSVTATNYHYKTNPLIRIQKIKLLRIPKNREFPGILLMTKNELIAPHIHQV